MIKTFLKAILAPFAQYAAQRLALWAEFGDQLKLPGYRSNSSYTSLSATKYIFVQATGAYRANMAANPTSTAVLGVMQNNPDVDEAMTIAVAGLSKVVAGAAITVNQLITCDTSGRAAAVTSGDMACGRALEASGADGDVITAMLFHPVRWSGAA